MTWLFTQVWLWSLAAFALGSLITWLLFVRPLQRRLNSVTGEYADYVDYVEHAAPETEEGPLDLLDPPELLDPPDRLGPAREPEPMFGDWDRAPRPWSTRVTAEAPAEVTQQVPAVGGDTIQSEVPAAEPEEPQTTEAPTWFQKASVDDVESSPDWPDAQGAETPAAQKSSGVWTPPADEKERAEAETSEARDDQSESESKLSGQLRSLFEPVADENPPSVPPLGAEVTQNIPRVVEDGDNPLPRRTPGAGPRPGQLRRTVGDPPEGEPAPEPAEQDAESETNGAASEEPARPRREGYMIKGHFASRQYHTPESPQYERIVAEVWFRTPADAEQAGFEPWDGREAE